VKQPRGRLGRAEAGISERAAIDRVEPLDLDAIRRRHVVRGDGAGALAGATPASIGVATGPCNATSITCRVDALGTLEYSDRPRGLRTRRKNLGRAPFASSAADRAAPPVTSSASSA
jgi:hypothetical protein